MAFKIGDNTVIDDNRALTAVGVTAATNLNIPSGNTAGRPTGAVGKLYFDTDLGNLIVYNGTAWVVAGSSELDLSKHNETFRTPPFSYVHNGSTKNYEYIAPYNEAVSYGGMRITDTTAEMFAHYIKPKSLPHEVILSHNVTGLGTKYNNLPLVVSLDNKACSYTFGGKSQGGVNKYIQNVIFDSTYSDSYFRIDSDNDSGLPIGHTESQLIWKYSDTCYLCWNKWHMRAYNPANVTQGSAATKIFSKNYFENDGQGSNRQHIMALSKSATANCVTVWCGLMNINTNPSGSAHLRIYDVDVTDGSVNGQAKTYEMPQNEIISLLDNPPVECSTHVVFLNQKTSTTGGFFYIWNKSTRELKTVTNLEYYGPSYSGFQSAAFRMNDKVYYVNHNKSTTNNTYGAKIYEVTATGASGYAEIITSSSGSPPIFDSDQGDRAIWRHGPQHSTNSFTWHYRDLDNYHSGSLNSNDNGEPLQYISKTVNWETSKTALGDGFDDVYSQALTHSPTVSSALTLSNTTIDSVTNATNGTAPADFAGEMVRIKLSGSIID